MPSQVCCGKVALYRARLRVGACTDRLLSPCHHPPVSHLLPRKCLVGRTVAPSQLQAAPTPRRCDGSKDEKKPSKRAFWTFAMWDDMAVIFLCARLPEGRPKKKKNLWSHNAVGFQVRSSRPSAGKFLASPHARDNIEPRPPWRTPSCNSLGNHLQQQKKHHEQTVTQTSSEQCSHAKGAMGTVYLTVFQNCSRQYSNNIENSN